MGLIDAFYNKTDFKIVEYKNVVGEVKSIILENALKAKASETINLEEYIKKESKGGKFDFKNQVEKNESPFILFDGIMYNKKDFAILLWSAAVKKAGISDLENAKNLWETINERKLTEPEYKSLKKGFETNFK